MNMTENEESYSDVVVSKEAEAKEVYSNKDWQTVLQEIKDIISDLNGNWVSNKLFSWFSADELSDMWGRLAVLQSSLIPYRIEAFRQIQIHEQFLKAKNAQARIDVKKALSEKAKEDKDKAPTADDISAEVGRQLVRASLLKAFHQTEYEKLQSYWYSIPNILFRIEQRINFIIWDRNTSKFMKDANDVPIPEIWKQLVSFWNSLD